jgi:hypothetical protein
VSAVPPEIPGIGSSEQKLRSTPGFDPLKSGLGPEEYFVWSRVDGSQTARQILLAIGLPVDRGVTILTRLRTIGALLLPSETTPPTSFGPGTTPSAPRTVTPAAVAPPRAPTSPVVGRTPTPRAQTVQGPGIVGRTPTPRAPAASGMTPAAAAAATAAITRAQTAGGATPARAATSSEVSRPTPSAPPPTVSPAALDERFDLRLANATRDEMNALTEDVELDDRTRRLVLALARLVPKNDPHALLGVGGDADVKAVKRGYRAMSKEIHPDRYYSKRVGTFKDRLAYVFEAVTRAHNRLIAVDPKKQAGRTADEPQTPAEHAAEVFEQACTAEVAGDYARAGTLFAAAIRTDPQTRFLRSAASCALAANQPKSAVEYAKKAQANEPYDPSSARLLAKAFRAAGKLADAEEVLVMAMAMKSENDVLTSELRYDLAEVRRLMME